MPSSSRSGAHRSRRRRGRTAPSVRVLDSFHVSRFVRSMLKVHVSAVARCRERILKRRPFAGTLFFPSRPDAVATPGRTLFHLKRIENPCAARSPSRAAPCSAAPLASHVYTHTFLFQPRGSAPERRLSCRGATATPAETSLLCFPFHYASTPPRSAAAPHGHQGADPPLADADAAGAGGGGARARAPARVACGVLLLLLAGGSAARRGGQFLGADLAARLSGDGRGDVHQDQASPRDGGHGTMESPIVQRDKLIGALLAPGFDEQSCLSRYQSALYRKESPHLLSTYLLERLREQEVLQKKCGPHIESYNKAIEQLKSGHDIKVGDCNYSVWVSYSGLGNRILTITSAFLYAILTNRVLLVDGDKGTADLFCEPFPETSWLLPSDFPFNQFKNFGVGSPESYGNMLKTEDILSDGSFKGPKPAFIYLHLAHDYDDYDKLFFCEHSQQHLQRIPWLILRSDNYFVPSLFLIPAYQEELMRLFPQKDTVFHHLGRYLFHPTNVVWGLITRYYDSYLSTADEKLGIQIRVFDTETGPFQHVLDQVLSCTPKENLLQGVNAQQPIISTRKVRSKVVLITSLNSGYYERIRNMYWEHPTTNGEIISFHQPSHEEHQDSDKKMHNMKAWAEIYLLSLSDVMVTSAWSTFGYVAQGLSGLKTWLMFKPENHTAPNPPCRQFMSMEQCFHAPPFYDCKARRGTDTGKLVPHVRHCEDMSWGLKVVDTNER